MRMSDIPLAERVSCPRLQERFWAKVEKTDSCWNWTASLNEHGYGQFYVGKHPVTGTTMVRRAHIVSWVTVNGERPLGDFVIDHLCRNKKCVNPDHLEMVTNRENIMRSPYMQPGAYRAPRRKLEVCRKGLHSMDLAVFNGGQRTCGPCRKEYMAEWHRQHPDRKKRQRKATT